MTHTFGNSVRNPSTLTSTSTANPLSTSFTCVADSTVLVALISYIGITARGGGAPTYNGVGLTQADTNRGQAEASAEIWYLLDPPTGSAYTLSVPNSGGIALNVVIATAKAQTGYKSVYNSVGYRTAVSTNPYADVSSTDGDVVFAIVADGDNSFSPTARTGINLYQGDVGSWGYATQYLLETTTGTRTMSWTETTSDDYGAIAVSFKEEIPATPIVVASTAHTHSVDETALTQHQLLVMESASQLHYADNITLTYHPSTVLMILDNTAHAHSITEPVLVPHVSLTVSDTSHLQYADPLAFTQHQSLLIDNSSHTHYVDNLTLTLYINLSVDNSSHVQSADNLDLATTLIVVPDNVIHLHYSDPLSLIQHQNLLLSSSTHTHAVGDLVISISFAIIVSNNIHLQSSENASLVAHYAIVTSDTNHLFSSDSKALVQHQKIATVSLEHLQSSESKVLIQHHVLAVDSTTHAHDGEEVHFALVAGDTRHNHSTTAIAIVQHQAISLNNVIHSHTSDNIMLVVTLLVGNSAHAQLSDNIVLVQHYQLLVDSSSHTNTTTGANLAQHHSLISNSISHAQSSENTNLIQHAIISVNNTEHVLFSSYIIMSGATEVDDAVQAQQVNNISLIQHHVLAVANTTHLSITSEIIVVHYQAVLVNNSSHAHSSNAVVLVQHQKIVVNNSSHTSTSTSNILIQHHALVVNQASHGMETLYAKSVVPNGRFDTDDGWTFETPSGWASTGGIDNSSCAILNSFNDIVRIYREDIPVVAGVSYIPNFMYYGGASAETVISRIVGQTSGIEYQVLYHFAGYSEQWSEFPFKGFGIDQRFLYFIPVIDENVSIEFYHVDSFPRFFFYTGKIDNVEIRYYQEDFNLVQHHSVEVSDGSSHSLTSDEIAFVFTVIEIQDSVHIHRVTSISLGNYFLYVRLDVVQRGYIDAELVAVGSIEPDVISKNYIESDVVCTVRIESVVGF